MSAPVARIPVLKFDVLARKCKYRSCAENGHDVGSGESGEESEEK